MPSLSTLVMILAVVALIVGIAAEAPDPSLSGCIGIAALAVCLVCQIVSRRMPNK